MSEVWVSLFGWIVTLWLVRTGTGMMAQGRINLDLCPCPVIMAGGIGGGQLLAILP